VKLVTSKQMFKIDRAAIDDYGIAGAVLMENAGRQVAEAVLSVLAESADPRATVLIVAGSGNNGGDGLVAARHLQKHGVDARVCLLGKGDDLRGDARTNYKATRKCSVPIAESINADDLALDVTVAGVLVDAILGTGAKGEVKGVVAEAIRIMNASGKPIIAVDIPSGISVDTGQVLGVAVEATCTITFGLPKVGLYCYPGRAHCGQIRIADIGLPAELVTMQQLSRNLTTFDEARAMLPPRWPEMHKGDAGRLLVVAGSVGMSGAAALSGLGALRAGAGLVTIACPASMSDVLETKCTETLTMPLPETERRCLSVAAIEPLLAAAQRVNAVAIGPGLSRDDEVREVVTTLVREITQPVVLDADGLNVCAQCLDTIRERKAPLVITPHPGELARLLDRSPEDVQSARLAAARDAAEGLDCVVVLKGAGTVASAPEGETWLNPTGNHGMASGGMGDVLTGVIGAFMAAGVPPLRSAVAGAYYHGLAGDMAAALKGTRGLIASDLLETLPAAFELMALPQ
jgi:ADP-dependent NAD(P)H-hydrate dehydratase / NAD(P)H-hydrate epimerase